MGRAGRTVRLLPAVAGALLIQSLLSPIFCVSAPLAAGGVPTLVLPFRSIGLGDTTVLVARDLLCGELEARGVNVVAIPGDQGSLLQRSGACDEPECAAAAARERQADVVIYGSMSRLGEKIVVRARALRVGEDVPFFNDQLSAVVEEDLDIVMRRFAEGIASGRPNSDQPSVDSVTLGETAEPTRRAGRSGFGLRAGLLYPIGNSYGDGERMTNVRFSFRYEARNLLVESTTLTGLSWRGDNVEWTILDIFVGRIGGFRDTGYYFGGGLGIHALNVHRKYSGVRFGDDGYPYGSMYGSRSQSSTTVSADAGVGLVALRTYDFQIIADLRLHHVFESFDKVGGNGADGILFTLGTSR